MTLPGSPPVYGSWSAMLASIKVGESGWRAFALQSALVTLGQKISADGDFGPLTKKALVAYQSSRQLDADGIAGPATQKSLLAEIGRRVDKAYTSLPDGLSRGFAEAEGANILAATNATVPGGVDCGPAQLRCYGPAFNPGDLRGAFDADSAFRVAAQALKTRLADFHRQNPNLSDGTLLRIGLLAHNAPFLSQQVVDHGHLLTPNAIASWTSKPGGGSYTHAEWLQVYPDRVGKYLPAGSMS